MKRNLLHIVLSCLTVVCIWVPYGTYADEAARMITGLSQQSMPGSHGGTLSMDWLTGDNGSLVLLGAEKTIVDTNHWTLFSAGGVQKLDDVWTFSGDIDIGPAETDLDAFVYKKLRAEILYRISNVWTLSTQDMYIGVKPMYGHIISAGAQLVRENGRTYGMKLSHSISGNIDDKNISIRADYRRRAPYLITGLVYGRSNNHLLLNLPVTEASETKLRQAFIGISFLLKATELTLIVDLAKVGDLDRVALSAVLNQPINWSD